MPVFHSEKSRRRQERLRGILVNDVRTLEEHLHLGERTPFDLGSLQLTPLSV